MTENVYQKLDRAGILDTAMRFYLEKRNYFCAIHLAGAAEELLGAHLPPDERIFTRAWKAERALAFFETGQPLEGAAARASINEWKNEIKHMDDGTDATIAIDPPTAAAFHINQALVNFYKLGLAKSQTLRQFEDFQNQEIRQARVD